MKLYVLCDKFNRVFWLIGQYDAESPKWKAFNDFVNSNETRLNVATMCNMCTPEAERTESGWKLHWTYPDGQSEAEHQEFLSRPIKPIREFDESFKCDRILVPDVIKLIDEFEKTRGEKL